MGADNKPSETPLTLEERLSDEADLCRNEGATDIASLLDDARAAVIALAHLCKCLAPTEAHIASVGKMFGPSLQGKLIHAQRILAARAALQGGK